MDALGRDTALEESRSELCADAPRVAFSLREIAGSLPWVAPLYVLVILVAVVLETWAGLENAISSAIVDGGVLFLFGLLVEQVGAKRAARRRWKENLPLLESAARQVWTLTTDAADAVLQAAGVASTLYTADGFGPTELAAETREALADATPISSERLEPAKDAVARLSGSSARHQLGLDDEAVEAHHAASEFMRHAEESLHWLHVLSGSPGSTPDLRSGLNDSLGKLIEEWERFFHAARRRWGVPLTMDESVTEAANSIDETLVRAKEHLAALHAETAKLRQESHRRLGLTEDQGRILHEVLLRVSSYEPDARMAAVIQWLRRQGELSGRERERTIAALTSVLQEPFAPD